MYIRNHAAEAGQNQIVGINLGSRNGLKTGPILAVRTAGRVVHDRISDTDVTLPEENIGEIIILAPQKKASLALVTHSTNPINIGDAVGNQIRR